MRPIETEQFFIPGVGHVYLVLVDSPWSLLHQVELPNSSSYENATLRVFYNNKTRLCIIQARYDVFVDEFDQSKTKSPETGIIFTVEDISNGLRTRKQLYENIHDLPSISCCLRTEFAEALLNKMDVLRL